jgi:hypothetical protein
LPEQELRDGLVQQVQTEAAATSYTGYALQAGSRGTSSTRQSAAGTSSTHPKSAGTSSTHPKASAAGPESRGDGGKGVGTSSTRLIDCGEQSDLVDLVNKILPKYNK